MLESQELLTKPEIPVPEEKTVSSMTFCKKEDLLLHQTQSTPLIDY